MRAKPQYVIGLVVIALGITVLLLSTQSKVWSASSFLAAVTPSATEDPTCGPHPNKLGRATEQEIATVALEFTQQQYPSQGKEPVVRFVRRVTGEELPQFGLAAMTKYVKNPPPYALVILQGNFNVNNMRGSHGFARPPVEYLGYIYDLWAGFPTVIMADPTGASFRTALNDPDLSTLPPTPVVDASALGATSTGSPWSEIYCYGDTLPPSGPAPQLEPTNTPLPFEPSAIRPSYPPPAK